MAILIMVREFGNGPGDLGSTPGVIIPKTHKQYLKPPCIILSIIRNISGTNVGKEYHPSLYIGVVGIEIGDFKSTMVS